MWVAWSKFDCCDRMSVAIATDQEVGDARINKLMSLD